MAEGLTEGKEGVKSFSISSIQVDWTITEIEKWGGRNSYEKKIKNFVLFILNLRQGSEVKHSVRILSGD